MKKISLILIALLLFSCVQNNYNNAEKKTKSTTASYLHVNIEIKEGTHDYYLKQIGDDSLFVNVYWEEVYGEHSRGQYIYFTKGKNVKSLEWETGGKFSEKISVQQGK